MIRKQIYLPEELGRRLAVASRQQQKSEAELVREALTDKLATAPVSAGTALLKLAELGRRLDISLPPDASAKHDDLYGDRK
jgi:plasmid stability protein